MSGFGDFSSPQSSSADAANNDFLSSADPTADFLAREQAILGDSANAFAGGDNTSSVVSPTAAASQFPPVDGFSDFSAAPIESTPAPSEAVQDDLFGAEPTASAVQSTPAFTTSAESPSASSPKPITPVSMVPEIEPEIVR
ncbi:hypothetical protein BKA69DRAFT_1088534 [Paraphysoderma sedebokerense]|nr:hypothetical protein BKA69DRAFT_1088534 [Paraphysoderma sedebokerense]